MQELWNILVNDHDNLIRDWDDNTPQETKTAAYDQFWEGVYATCRDKGEALGLAGWHKWHIFESFRTAQDRWAKMPPWQRAKLEDGGNPRVHHGLRNIILPHWTHYGGVPVDWLF